MTTVFRSTQTHVGTRRTSFPRGRQTQSRFATEIDLYARDQISPPGKYATSLVEGAPEHAETLPRLAIKRASTPLPRTSKSARKAPPDANEAAMIEAFLSHRDSSYIETCGGRNTSAPELEEGAKAWLRGVEYRVEEYRKTMPAAHVQANPPDPIKIHRHTTTVLARYIGSGDPLSVEHAMLDHALSLENTFSKLRPRIELLSATAPLHAKAILKKIAILAAQHDTAFMAIEHPSLPIETAACSEDSGRTTQPEATAAGGFSACDILAKSPADRIYEIRSKATDFFGRHLLQLTEGIESAFSASERPILKQRSSHDEIPRPVSSYSRSARSTGHANDRLTKPIAIPGRQSDGSTDAPSSPNGHMLGSSHDSEPDFYSPQNFTPPRPSTLGNSPYFLDSEAPKE